jgi:hypothetical protein
MAANGYPGTPETGGAIKGIDAAEATGAKVFHAGTRLDGRHPRGERRARAGRHRHRAPVGAAQAAAYRAVDAIDFPTGFCRRDIGWREVAREGYAPRRPSREDRSASSRARKRLREVRAPALAGSIACCKFPKSPSRCRCLGSAARSRLSRSSRQAFPARCCRRLQASLLSRWLSHVARSEYRRHHRRGGCPVG